MWPHGARAAAPARAADAVPALSEADRTDLARIEAYLNGLTTMQARFLQFSSDGCYAEGHIYVERPGRMRIEYDPPNHDPGGAGPRATPPRGHCSPSPSPPELLNPAGEVVDNQGLVVQTGLINPQYGGKLDPSLFDLKLLDVYNFDKSNQSGGSNR